MKPEQLGGEVFTPALSETVHLRSDFVVRSLDNNRWAQPLSLTEADHIIQSIGNPLIYRLKDNLAPFLTKPLAYSDGLNRALDEERRASLVLGIEKEYQKIKDAMGDVIGPKMKKAVTQSFWNGVTDTGILPAEVYREFQRMLEITERSVTWSATSQSPALKGLPNPFEQFFHLYMEGVVKIKFARNDYGTQWVNAHIPLRTEGRYSLLGCWTEMEEGISGTHAWNEDCTRKSSVYRSLGV